MEKKFDKKKIVILIGLFLFIVISGGIVYFINANKSYTVTFNTDGGDKIENIAADKEEAIDLPKDLVKDGCEFIGWKNEDGQIVPFTYTPTSNEELTATWICGDTETITIKFDTVGGSNIDDIKLSKGEVLTFPINPTKSGNTFVKWIDKDDNTVLDGTLFTEDTTLYAVWKEDVKETAKEYYCDEGYTLSGTKCIKTDTAQASSSSECKGTMIDNDCVDTSKTAQQVSSCSEWQGFTGTLLNSTCYYAPQEVSTSCNGTTYDGVCYLMTENPTYSCPNGYIEDGSATAIVCVKVIGFTTTYTCPNGYALNGSTCTKTTTVNAHTK